jgi:cytochrome c oxidase subunit 2
MPNRLAGPLPVSLHFGTVQIAAAAAFATLAFAFAAVFALVAVKSRDDIPYERVQSSGYWLRKRWLAVLSVVIVCGVGMSLFDLPYSGGAATGRTVVKVTGGQFFWSLVPDRVTVGTRVRFDVTAVDVNHGFGLYDPQGRLLGSVQAMPGYHNKLDLTLDHAGRYVIRCMEFCGLNHAAMESFFTVAQR